MKIVGILFSALVASSPGFAQNIQDSWFSFSSAAGFIAAGNLAVAGTVGEASTGGSQSGNTQVFSGFVPALAGASFVTSVGNKEILPLTFELYQNYPNPFNPSTTIQYDVPWHSKVTITIYNLLGQQVMQVVNDEKSPGRYTEVWHGRNDEGAQVASGVYFYRIHAESVGGEKRDFVMTKKLVLLK